MSWIERGADGDDLGLNLSMQLKFPSPKSPQNKRFLNSIAFQSSSASRPKTSLYKNKKFASSGSTISNRNRMRSEREDTRSEPQLASSAGGGGCDDSARKKLMLTQEQLALLEEIFKRQNTLCLNESEELAKRLNLETRQVIVWFQNRRARIKSKKIQVECANWKRTYKNLTEENQRLQKEIAEHKAQKNNPTATSLTMCPMCEHVSMLPQSSHATSSTPTSATGPNTQRHISFGPSAGSK